MDYCGLTPSPNYPRGPGPVRSVRVKKLSVTKNPVDVAGSTYNSFPPAMPTYLLPVLVGSWESQGNEGS